MIWYVLAVIVWFLVGFVGSGFVVYTTGEDIELLDLACLFLCGILGPAGLAITYGCFDGRNIVIIKGRR